MSGIRTKSDSIFMLSSQSTYDVIVIVETWLNSDFNDAEFFDTRMFNVFRKDRDGLKTGCTRGGGVLIAVKKSFKSILMDLPNSDTLIDQLCIRLEGLSGVLICIVSYIPPNSNASLYEAHIQNIAECVPKNDCDGCVVLGDFNLGKIVWSTFPDSNVLYANNVNSPFEMNFIDTMCSLDLDQVNFFYNSLNKILDLAFISKNINYSIQKCDHPFSPQDLHHVPLVLNAEFYLFKKVNCTNNIHYDYNRCNFDVINELIMNTNWYQIFNGKSLESCYSEFVSMISNVCSSNIPRLKPNSYKLPWYTPGLKKLKNLRNKYYNVFKSTGSPVSKRMHDHYSREFTFLNKFLYKQYIVNYESKINNNPKSFFQFIKSKNSNSDFPSVMFYGEKRVKSSQEQVNLFADFFKTNFQPGHQPIDDQLLDNVKSAIDFEVFAISETDIISGLSSLKESTKLDIDGISAHFLKKCSSSICVPLAYIFNYSLKIGKFLEGWKICSITPVYKSGPKGDICNYRPISKLSNISKLFEYVVYSHIFLSVSPILTESQHGFIKNRSTVSNLLVFANHCLTGFEMGYQVDTIYLDFCKAFDKVLHSILLLKLEKIGFHPIFLRWIKSYLLNRRCFVYFDDCKSDLYIATSGIPQGSVLGPLFFILFINDITNCFHYARCLIYADDVKIFLNVKNLLDTLLLQGDINRLFSWCELNKLPLNISKCFFLPFSRRTRLVDSNYDINNHLLSKVDKVLDLGVLFDSKMNFRSHIDYILPKAYSVLAFIKRNSKDFLNPYTRKILYVSFVRSRLEYASLVWNPFYKIHCDRIERLQRKFIKFALLSLNYSEPIPPYISRCRLIHLETLSNRRAKSSVLFLYKLVAGVIDCPLLLSRIGFNVPIRNLRFFEVFNVPLHRSNYSCNEPIVRSLREFNSINMIVDLDPSLSINKFIGILDLYFF